MTSFKKYLAWSTVGLLAYMPFHILLSQWLSTFTGGLDAWKIGKDVVTALLTLLCVTAVLTGRKHTRVYLALLIVTILYLALHLLLLGTSHQPLDTGLLGTTYNVRLMCYGLIGYSVALLVPKLIRPTLLIRLLLVLSTLVCLIGLLQWVLPKDVMTHFGYSLARGVKPAFFIDDKSDLPRLFSTLRDPNSLGAFLILPITLLVYGLIKSWRTSHRVLLTGLLMLHGLILFLTFSRSAWLGAIVSLGLLGLIWNADFNKKVIKKYWPLLAAGLVVLVGLVFVLKDQYIVQNVVFHSDENTKQTDSNNLHLIKIERGVHGIADQPFGYGPGTAGLVSIHNPDGGLLTENYFIQIAYEVGIIGLVILLAFMALILRNLWPCRHQALPLALLASFVGLTLMNLLLHTWANEAVACSWFLLAGFSMSRND